MHFKRKYELTKEQKTMYSSEKIMNFRWISKVLAKRSSYILTLDDLAPMDVATEISDLGQFSEAVYSAIPFDFLFKNATVLSKPGFPLEGYPILQECNLVASCKGKLANLPAYIAYRPKTKQLVVAISGTQSTLLAFHDLRALMHRHPSKMGKVHSGFWGLYKGIHKSLFDAINDGLAKHDVAELVITGHSMGGAISYLLAIDLLRAAEISDARSPKMLLGVRLKLVVFGAPRTADPALVIYWKRLLTSYRAKHGRDALVEYSLKAYNDGVPALPPLQFGYVHFAEESFYLDKSRLFRVPSSEREYTVFTISPETISPASSQSKYVGIEFPRGGHNYYNNRDMERLIRRLTWLSEVNFTQNGWEEWYLSIVTKRTHTHRHWLPLFHHTETEVVD